MTIPNSPGGGRAPFCNGTGHCSTDPVPKSEIWGTLMAVYLGAILLMSLAFNGTICLVFYKKPQLLSISNCFVLNLACCQLCMAIFVLPFSLVAVVSRGLVYHGAWCDIQGFFFTLVIVTLNLSLLIISLDRNYAIMNSLRYPNVFTQTLCSVLISVSWVTGAVISIPPLFDLGFGQYKFHPHQFICTLNWSTGTGYLIIFSLCTFAIPIMVQACCYIKIFKAAVGHSKRSARVQPWVTQSSSKVFRDEEEPSDNSSDGINSDQSRKKAAGCKAVRTIFMIAFVYCVSWVPYFCDSLLHIVHDAEIPNLSAVTICCIFSSGILNPIVYAYMNRVTRREIGRFLCGSHTVNEDFVSTSMSTYTLAKQNAQLRGLRSRNASGVNSEMKPIPEEAEDSGISESRSAIDFQLAEQSDYCAKTKPACKNSVMFQASSVKLVGEENEHVKETPRSDDQHDNIQKKANRVNLEVKSGIIVKKCMAINKMKSLQRKSGSRPNKCDERRRVRKSTSEMHFSKERGKRKRDCGSFLYFENYVGKSKRGIDTAEFSPASKRDKRQVSLGHMETIAVNTRPKMLKFRFSISDADDAQMTVKSDVTFNNDKFPPVFEDSESSSDFAVFDDNSSDRREQAFNIIGLPGGVSPGLRTPEPEMDSQGFLNIGNERCSSVLSFRDNASPSGVTPDVGLQTGLSTENGDTVHQIEHLSDYDEGNSNEGGPDIFVHT